MRTRTHRRRYTNDERARAVAAVAACGGSVHGTARKLGIPETSLRQWCSGRRHPELLPLSEQKRRELAERFGRVVDLALDVALARLHKLDAYRAVLCAAIALDKAMQLRGELPMRRSRSGR